MEKPWFFKHYVGDDYWLKIILGQQCLLREEGEACQKGGGECQIIKGGRTFAVQKTARLGEKGSGKSKASEAARLSEIIGGYRQVEGKKNATINAECHGHPAIS